MRAVVALLLITKALEAVLANVHWKSVPAADVPVRTPLAFGLPT